MSASLINNLSRKHFVFIQDDPSEIILERVKGNHRTEIKLYPLTSNSWEVYINGLGCGCLNEQQIISKVK